jgi:tripeptidyl-peptidase-1
VSTIKTWLVSAGIPSDRIVQSTNKAWIAFDATTSEVEGLLYTEFHVYEHTATGTENIAAEEYHVPSHVREHIDYITPGIRLRVDPGKAKQLKRRSMAEGLRKRGVEAMNTGAVPIEEVKGNARLPTLPTLTRANCDRYVTNQCIRSKLHHLPLSLILPCSNSQQTNTASRRTPSPPPATNSASSSP